jgi:hypothetical protein
VLRKKRRRRFYGVSGEGGAGEMLRVCRFLLLPFLYGGKPYIVIQYAVDYTHLVVFQTFGQVVLEALAFGLVSSLLELETLEL